MKFTLLQMESAGQQLYISQFWAVTQSVMAGEVTSRDDGGNTAAYFKLL